MFDCLKQDHAVISEKDICDSMLNFASVLISNVKHSTLSTGLNASYHDHDQMDIMEQATTNILMQISIQ